MSAYPDQNVPDEPLTAPLLRMTPQQPAAVVDGAGVILGVSEPLLAALAWPREALIGHSLDCLLASPRERGCGSVASKEEDFERMSDRVMLRAMSGALVGPLRVVKLPAGSAGRAHAVLLPATSSREAQLKGDPYTPDPRFDALIHASFDAYYAYDIDTDYNEFGTQIDRILGMRPGELARDYGALLAQIHPEDRQHVADLVEECIRDKKPYSDEYRLLRTDGTYATVTDSGLVLYDVDGRPLQMVGVIRDVTEERRAETELRELYGLYSGLFTDASNPIVLFTRDLRYRDANRAALEFLQETPQSIVTLGLAAHLLPTSHQEVLRAVNRVGSGSEESARVEVDLRVASALKVLALTIVGVEYKGEPVFFGLGTDLTQIREMDAELRREREVISEQAASLQRRSIALGELLAQRERDREELEETVRTNVGRFVRPALDALRNALRGSAQTIYVDALWQTLLDILRPVAQDAAGDTVSGASFTAREREILAMIRAGKSTSEIAKGLFISPATVGFHRGNIRRKLNLGRNDPHLATHLGTLRWASDTEERSGPQLHPSTPAPLAEGASPQV